MNALEKKIINIIDETIIPAPVYNDEDLLELVSFEGKEQACADLMKLQKQVSLEFAKWIRHNGHYVSIIEAKTMRQQNDELFNLFIEETYK